MLSAFFLLIQLGLAIYITYLTIAFFTGAPFVPSSKRTAQAMFELANIKPGLKVYDLGSGDGRLLFLAARAGASAVGFEINPFLVIWTRLKILFSPYRKTIRVYWKNFWRGNFSDADVIFVYLLPWRMEQLKKMMFDQVKSGTIIVSNSFIFKEWKIVGQNQTAHVYVFQVPSMKKIATQELTGGK